MRLSGVFDTIFTISKRKIANYVHRRVREASKNGLGRSVWVTVGACVPPEFPTGKCPQTHNPTKIEEIKRRF